MNSKKMKMMYYADVKRAVQSIKIFTLLLVSASMLGCKKYSDNSERNYGYAKITVECNKCNVAFSNSGQETNFEVDNSIGINYIRYKQNYTLDINITPLDAAQDVTLSVYGRNGKQVFRNTSSRIANELWNSKIVIP